ncbi:GL20207 [Drosophila persimilis]|uniref:GL20207 n=1 Tax=Drosophila persimilis TaxID=7234 RepID=B4GXT3_DROPE|nr:cytochrome P450 4d1 [Drosophila persimilis]EDW27560.1 GL20207 [Drosophila persimilis]
MANAFPLAQTSASRPFTWELFSEPNSFKPERFDVVTSAEKLNPYAYIPFSAGPRNCIGQKFAMLEIKAIVANVLRHYHIDFVGDTTEPPVLIAELILRTKDPLLFKLRLLTTSTFSRKSGFCIWK